MKHAVDKSHLHHSARCLAIIDCEDAEKWEGSTELLWKDALHEPGDRWTLYKACGGELPTPAEAARFDGVIIGGSHYSAYEEHQWINKMLELLPQYVAQGARIYGCCFGCQVLARALGGSVGTNPDGNFVLTLEQIQPTPELQQISELHEIVQQALAGACNPSSNSNNNNSSRTTVQLYPAAADTGPELVKAGEAAAGVPGVVDGLQQMQMACSSGCFRLIESHGDQVLTLPPGAIRLATSPTAVNELWCYGPNVLASQFHLEFDEPLVLDKIWKTLKDVGRLDEQQAEESRRVLEAGGQQNASMLQVIRYFLRHGLPGVPPVSIKHSTGDNSGSSSGGDDGSGEKTTPIPSSSTGSSSGPSNGTTNADSSLHNSTGGNSSNGKGSGGDGSRSAGSGAQQQPQQNAAGGGSSDPVVHQRQELPELDISGSGSLAPVLTHLHPSLGPAQDLSAALPSGASSPMALSEHSIATAASTSSTVPFSQIAYQRRQQQREEGLAESSQHLVGAAAAAFDLRMDYYDLDLGALQQLNEAAAEQYNSTAELGTALCQFVADMETRQAAAREALAVLPQLDRQLKLLENAVGQLDRRSKELEGRLGLGKSSAYDYLASTFGKAGSSVSAAAYYAAGGGACLGGAAAPKQ